MGAFTRTAVSAHCLVPIGLGARARMSGLAAHSLGHGTAPHSGRATLNLSSSPGADVAGVRPVPVQMWRGYVQSRRRCGRGEPNPVILPVFAKASQERGAVLCTRSATVQPKAFWPRDARHDTMARGGRRPSAPFAHRILVKLVWLGRRKSAHGAGRCTAVSLAVGGLPVGLERPNGSTKYTKPKARALVHSKCHTARNTSPDAINNDEATDRHPPDAAERQW